MPAKLRITRDMIIEAAYFLLREKGGDYISARHVAQKLECSTQPVMYQFKTTDELKKAVYEKARKTYGNFIVEVKTGNPVLDVAFNYVRFAYEERNMFRFLFETDNWDEKTMAGFANVDFSNPVIKGLAVATNLSEEKALLVFRHLFIFANGYAALFANKNIDYMEDDILKNLTLNMQWAINSLKNNPEVN